MINLWQILTPTLPWKFRNQPGGKAFIETIDAGF
jgi:hypothetical protein